MKDYRVHTADRGFYLLNIFVRKSFLITSSDWREVYEEDENCLAIVATDRLSTFDVIFDFVTKHKKNLYGLAIFGLIIRVILYRTISFRQLCGDIGLAACERNIKQWGTIVDRRTS